MTTPFDQYEAYTVKQSVLPLHRYAQIVGQDECGFWGVTYEGQADRDCNKIWSEYFRQLLAWALLEAQQEIENYVRFPLQPKWVTGKSEDQPDIDWRLVDQQTYKSTNSTKWRRIIQAGIRAESTVSSGESVDHTADPAVIGPVVVSFTETSEVVVTHPGTDREIKPSSITISGGNLTVYIPRCRMVKTSLLNSTLALDYETESNFESTVDIKRVYNDPSTNAKIITPHTCSNSCATSGCSEYSQNGCIYIQDEKLGIVSVLPATYSSGSWSRTTDLCCNGSILRLNYQCGLQQTDQQVELAIIHLAHTKLPNSTCLCGIAQAWWQDDRNEPSRRNLSRTRQHCPFGPENGAWKAFQIAKQLKEEVRVSVF